MRSVLLVVALAWFGCGSVSVKADAARDGTSADTGGDGPASTCGAAGQPCCASTTNKCMTNLKCTTLDEICRTAEVFFAAADANNTTGVATIGRGDGVSFTLQSIGTGAPTAIWGTSATDVWVIVEGPNNNNGQTSWARHWDGGQWGSQMNFPDGSTVYALWGNAPDNYWAVNNAGSAFHWNGQAWSAAMSIASSEVFEQIWGSSSTDVFAAGAGTPVHLDSSGTWSPVTLTGWGGFAMHAISGHANGDFVSGGLDTHQPQRPAVLRRSAGTYTVEPIGDGSDCAETTGLWDGPDDEWALTAAQIQAGNCDAHPTVVHYSGGTWTAMGKLPDSSTAIQLWGTSNKDLFSAGVNAAGAPAVFHYNGTAWTTTYTNTTQAITSIRAIWGVGGLP